MLFMFDGAPKVCVGGGGGGGERMVSNPQDSPPMDLPLRMEVQVNVIPQYYLEVSSCVRDP